MLLRRCRDEFFLADRARAYEPLKLGAGDANRLGRHVDGEMAAERRGILMLAEIAMRPCARACRPEPAPRKKTAKHYRIIG